MSSNYSYWAIPGAWAMAMAPHFYAIAMSKASKDVPEFDNVCPREYLQAVRKLEKQSPTAKKLLRAEAANSNGFETMGLFAAAIMAGNAARLDASTLNGFAGFYLATRALYNILYINTTDAVLSNIRSVSYVSGIVTICTLFVKAGRALDASRLF